MVFLIVMRELGLYQRCLGIFKKTAPAEDCLNTNYKNLSESGYYEFACLERVEEGFQKNQKVKQRIWYRWNEELNRYLKVDTPSWSTIVPPLVG